MLQNKKRIYWIIAGLVNLFTAFLHAIGGQISLVNPLSQSGLTDQEKAEWFGCWHMITIILFATSFLILKNGIKKIAVGQIEIIKIGYLYIAFSVSFIVASSTYQLLAPQFILLLPIGLLILLGNKEN